MKIRSTYKAALFFTVLIASVVHAAVISRVTNFSDGSVLFASQLNSEFNNVVGGVNNISNANITSNAAIDPAKLSAAIAGDGLSRDGTTGALSVSVDDTTIEVDSNQLKVKDEGVTNAKLAPMVALTVKANATNATATPTDVAAGSDGYVLARSGTALAFGQVQTAGIADNAVTYDKRAVRAVQATTATLGNVARSGALGTQSLTTTMTDLASLTVTITTAGGPVKIDLVPSASGGGFFCQNTTQDAWAVSIQLISGVTTLPSFFFSGTGSGTSGSGKIGPSAVSFLDFPAAGTTTYKVQAAETNISGNDCTASLMKMYAYEL